MFKHLNSKNIALTYLLLIPFLFTFANNSSPFEFIKLYVSGLVGCGLFAFLMWQYLRSRRVEIKWNTGLSFMLAILVSTLVSTFFSIDSYLSFWGDDQMPADSLVSQTLFFFFSFAVLQIFEVKKEINLIFNIVVICGSLLAVHGIAQHFGFDFETFSQLKSLQGRSIATIGQPVVFATVMGVVSLTALMQFFVHSQSKNKWFYFAALLILQLALLYSGSRMAFIVDKIFLAGICFYYFKAKKTESNKIISALLGGLAVLVVAVLAADRNAIIDKFRHMELKKTFESRELVLGDGLKAWKNAPFIGSGPETYYIVQKQNASIELNKFEYWRLRWTKAHSMPVHILVGQGLLGLVIFLLLPMIVGRRSLSLLIKNKFEISEAQKINAGLIFLFIFVAGLTAFNFIYTQMLFALSSVLFFSLDEKDKALMLNAKLRRGTAAMLFALSLWLMYSVHSYWLSDVFFQKSHALLAAQDNMEALNSVEKAIELHESNPFLHCHKANVLYSSLNLNKDRLSSEKINSITDLIIESSNSCIERGPNRFEPYFARGTLFSEMFKTNLVPDDKIARESLLKFKKLAPTHPGPDYLMGLLDEKKSAHADLEKHMYESLALKPDFFVAYIPLLRYYYSLHDREQINALFEKIISTETDSREAADEIKRMSQMAKENSDSRNSEKINAYYEKTLEKIKLNSDSLD